MIQIVKFNNKFVDKWEEFISTSNNGTIFHLRKFLSYHKERTFDDHSFLFYEILLGKDKGHNSQSYYIFLLSVNLLALY